MCKVGETKTYDELVHITEDYLGPAARRFIDRQTKNHLNKDPGYLTKTELITLADWVKLTLALLTKDETIKTEYARRLDKLVGSSITTR